MYDQILVEKIVIFLKTHGNLKTVGYHEFLEFRDEFIKVTGSTTLIKNKRPIVEIFFNKGDGIYMACLIENIDKKPHISEYIQKLCCND